MKMTDKDLLAKAERSFLVAEQLYEDGDYDFAVSRAYYALFYVSEALLLQLGKTYSKHSAVIFGIYENFVASEKLPKDFHQTLHWAYELRQKGDYASLSAVTKEDSAVLLRDVKVQMKIALALINSK